MQKTISITSKGQLHLPTKMRKMLGVEPLTRVTVEEVEGGLLLKRAEDPMAKFRELGGKYHHYLKNAPNVDLDNIRDVIDYSDL